jgi:hypothetical protein
VALAVLMIVAVGSLVAFRLRQPAETVYTAEADTYVSKAHPSANYGNAVALRTDATPRIYSYLRFRLDGRSGRVVRARLLLWSSTGSLAGYSVRRVHTTTWDEAAITFTRHPAAAEAVAKSGPFSPGSWSSVDVTRLVKGRDEVSVVVTTRSTKTITFDSREGTHQPQLVMQTRLGTAAPSIRTGSNHRVGAVRGGSREGETFGPTSIGTVGPAGDAAAEGVSWRLGHRGIFLAGCSSSFRAGLEGRPTDRHYARLRSYSPWSGSP